ncbi:MAG: phosphate ABC transporter permease subunit PstC [Acidimicrobiaceae bacterium]|nr:phosphate ABC transporter permease subunit PstC [Acidimicrobiaceae bacterium]
MTTATLTAPEAPQSLVTSRRTSGDKLFDRLSMGSAGFVLVILVAIAGFLIWKSWPALRVAGWDFFTERTWNPDAQPAVFGVAALVWGTLLSSILSLVIAVPLAVGCALLLVEVAPPVIARPVGYVIELLAAVPSVVYGLWGVYVLVPHLVPFQRWLGDNLSWIPFFHNPSNLFGRSMFVAIVILTIMVLPIVVSLARDVLRQVPSADREAAMALGATKWEVIRLAVLPYARGGITGSVMLGLGRALGETIAVAMVLSATYVITVNVLGPGGNTIAANIATKFGEAGPLGQQALVASGLVLFVITLIVNMLARFFVGRGVKASGRA